MGRAERGERPTTVVVWAVAVLVAVAVAVLTRDVILGVIAGAPCAVIGLGLVRLWNGDPGPGPRHR